MPRNNNYRPSFSRGVAGGLIGGLVGTLAMDAVSWAWSKSRDKEDDPAEASHIHQGGRPEVDEAKRTGRKSGEEEPTATTKIASKVGASMAGRPLSPEEKHHGGQMVHYSFGALTGAVYGGAAEFIPAVSAGGGTIFGLAVWAGGVEAALPALKLSGPPSDYSADQHVFSIISHIAYGAALELTRRAVSSAWNQS